ncbi:uncharacterized protein LOC134194128 [Corticium candelabrum]|uniref:uncharacterized protein LOC134194128 n=1 Tax=Corticium candelabrum TaxID=121492 RepID=UPI002E274B00|nr:uncharacterized protein LOC134194128 [Corticium candelabrum]
MAMTWHLIQTIVLLLYCSAPLAETTKSSVCYPHGTYDFVQGLLVPNLSAGVTRAADWNDGLAYEITETAKIARPFDAVLQQGHDPRIQYHQPSTWPGNFSVVMRVRLYTDRASILSIYSSDIRPLFEITAYDKSVALRFKGGKAVKIAKWNATDNNYHKIILTILGKTVTATVSEPNSDQCGPTRVTSLEHDNSDRRISLDHSLVLIGRVKKGLIVAPSVTIQQILFRANVSEVHTCPYEIPCPTTAEPTVSTTAAHKTSTTAIINTSIDTTTAINTTLAGVSEVPFDTTAAIDHTTAAIDHTTAAIDHTTAATDRTKLPTASEVSTEKSGIDATVNNKDAETKPDQKSQEKKPDEHV